MRRARWWIPIGGLLLAAASVDAAIPRTRKPVPAPALSHAPPEEDFMPPPAPGDPDTGRILRLQENLHGLVHGPGFAGTRVGVRVSDVRSGRTFFAHRAEVLMDPASNQKLLATASALLRLGNQFRFRTELRAAPPDDEGVVPGDLWLRGSGDPSLSLAAIDALAEQLAARGITRIAGGVLADRRRVGEVAGGAGTTESEKDRARSPLQLSRAMLVVRVRPGDRAGAPAVISVHPLSDSVVIKNRVRTSRSGRNRVRVGLRSEGDRIVVTVQGRVAVQHPGVVSRRRPPFPMQFAAALLHAAIRERGLLIGGGFGVATSGMQSTEPVALLAVHESAPLPELLRVINKASNNDYADRLLEVLGGEVLGGAPAMKKGVRVLRDTMVAQGLVAEGFVPVNGSGLGHRNRITANSVVDLLRALYFDPRIGPEILQSLSVGGVDGTTRNRFRRSPAAHLVRSKTGTLNGKSILSGYVGESSSEVLAFSILVERVPRGARTRVRNAQVRLAETLLRYVQGATGEAPVEAIEPGTDFEIDEDAEVDDPQLPAPEDPGDGADAGGGGT